MIIGVTGVFGSGKTIVSRLFAKKGYKVVNADEIGHRLLNKKPIKDKVINEFGKSILVNNRINRRKLKDIVFNNHRKLVRLNKIIHPPIIKEIKSIIKKNKNKKIIVDGALLIEAKCANLFDKIIVVKINRKEQLKRVLKKRKYNKKEINNITKSQLSQKEKIKYADYVIDNSGELLDTNRKVTEIINQLIE